MHLSISLKVLEKGVPRVDVGCSIFLAMINAQSVDRTMCI